MNGLIIPPFTTVTVSFVLALALTIWVRSILLKRNLLDRPNERSSHKTPVPRGGGWAILAILIPGMIASSTLHHTLPVNIWIIAGTILVALISWIDDKKGVSAVKRLSLHILAACIGSLTFAPNELLFAGALPFWLDRSVMIVGWAWFMNLYNFMDGIDGITSIETIALATGVSAVMAITELHDPFISTLILLLIGSCLAFLTLNWHPAKIFLGDIGSVPLGFLGGFILLSLATKGYLIPALIIPLYYLADSGITISKRALRGEKIWQAHRQHFYQTAAQGSGRHDKVVWLILSADIILICAALVAVHYMWLGFGLGVLAVAILLRKLHKMGHELPSP